MASLASNAWVFVALVLCILLKSTHSASAANLTCETPVTTTLIRGSDPFNKILSTGFETAVLMRGAQVRVAFTTERQAFSALSFDFGLEFTSLFTDEMKMTISNDSATDFGRLLTSPGDKRLIMYGRMSQQLTSVTWGSSGGWANGTRDVMYDGAFPPHYYCTANPSMFICAVANYQDPNINVDGARVVTKYISPRVIGSGNNSYLQSSKWLRQVADEVYVTRATPALASDGKTVMLCVASNLGNNAFASCYIAETGDSEYVPTLYSPKGASLTTPLTLASDGKNVSYIAAWRELNGDFRVMSTADGGDSPWLPMGVMLQASETFYDVRYYKNKWEVHFTDNEGLKRKYYNVLTNTWPNTTEEFISDLADTGGKWSYSPGGFVQNAALAYVDENTHEVLVKLCIPTASPTVSPTPSPSAAAETGVAAATWSVLAGVALWAALGAVLN